jgi:hypothetical protein
MCIGETLLMATGGSMWSKLLIFILKLTLIPGARSSRRISLPQHSPPTPEPLSLKWHRGFDFYATDMKS